MRSDLKFFVKFSRCFVRSVSVLSSVGIVFHPCVLDIIFSPGVVTCSSVGGSLLNVVLFCCLLIEVGNLFFYFRGRPP